MGCPRNVVRGHGRRHCWTDGWSQPRKDLGHWGPRTGHVPGSQGMNMIPRRKLPAHSFEVVIALLSFQALPSGHSRPEPPSLGSREQMPCQLCRVGNAAPEGSPSSIAAAAPTCPQEGL